MVGDEAAGLVVGGLVGSGVGFYAFVRSTTRLLDEQSKKKRNGKQ